MAQRLITIDDMDGSEGAEPITFAVEGVKFVIDLTRANRKLLYEALLPFIKNGRRSTGGGRMPDALRAMVGEVPTVAFPSSDKATNRGPDEFKRHSQEELRRVREFAGRYGIKVGPGRIPQDVWDCFHSERKRPDGGSEPDFSLLKKGRLPATEAPK